MCMISSFSKSFSHCYFWFKVFTGALSRTFTGGFWTAFLWSPVQLVDTMVFVFPLTKGLGIFAACTGGRLSSSTNFTTALFRMPKLGGTSVFVMFLTCVIHRYAILTFSWSRASTDCWTTLPHVPFESHTLCFVMSLACYIHSFTVCTLGWSRASTYRRAAL